MKTKLLIALLAASLPGSTLAASLSEPATVFYGKVINQAGPATNLLTSGQLTWTIEGGEGEEDIVLSTALAAHSDGQFSYRLDVPNSVIGLGLDSVKATLPAGVTKTSRRHLAIRVDDRAATIKSPGQYSFDIGAVKRAATHRLDLVVTVPEEDTDGDGMPDWWEEENGLDLQSNDAAGDLDGDGITNLQEYLGGSSANHDNRGPELLTSDLLAYAGARTGVLLETFDLDSAPAQIVFTLDSLPEEGALFLRNALQEPIAPDREVEVGDQFTQADVNGGRLLVQFDDAPELPTVSFQLSVRDEVPDHESASGTIEVRIFTPTEDVLSKEVVAAAPLSAPLPGVAADDEVLIRNAALGREHGFVIWDSSDTGRAHLLSQPTSDLTEEDYLAQYLPAYGAERSQVITGGSGPDHLAGGMSADLITGGAGDDELRGGGGPDRFVVASEVDGNDTLRDFVVGPEGDALDLSRVLKGASTSLVDYMQLREVADGRQLGIDFNGDGSGFTDMRVTMTGLPGESDLYSLVGDGNLLVGALQLRPRVEIAASIAEALENGPSAGEFAIRRAGSTASAVEVNILIAGSASNGVDYSLVASRITIPAGEASAAVPIMPFADNQFEVPEVVEITLLDGEGYELGSSASAQVVIEDLKPEISVTALVPRAEVATGQPGVFLLSRTEMLDRDVLVRLAPGGTATASDDYTPLPQFVALSAGQSFRLIEVVPRPSAQISEGAETVTLSVVRDATYLAVAPQSAKIVIVPESVELAAWRARHFAGNEEDLEVFANGDTGDLGIVHLVRYGFTLDPMNPLHSGPGARPGVALVDGYLTLSYRENPAARDLQYRIETSTNLKVWRAVDPAEMEEVTPLEAPAGRRILRSKTKATAAAREFLRVRVTREAP